MALCHLLNNLSILTNKKLNNQNYNKSEKSSNEY